MTILPESIDYTDKDFESLRARMFDLISSVFPDWSDDSVANFGNILIEGFCFIGDVLNFYQDQQAREGRFETVQLRKNMIALAKLTGYTLQGATAASCDLVFTITNPTQLTGYVTPSTTPVIVGTKAITNPVKGEVQDVLSFNISAGEFTKTVSWRHSITQSPVVKASDGKADQRYLMPFGPFLSGTDSVSTPTQGPWVLVDSFFESGPTDPHYRIQVDQNDRVEFIFGDGKNGVIPIGNITMNYQIGGGAGGNVEKNSLEKIDTSFYDTNGNRAFVTVTNAAAASGGSPRQEVEAGRIAIPRSRRVLTRTISREDYEINALRVAGVGRVLHLTSNEDAAIAENRGKLFVIPLSGGVPSTALLDDVRDMVTNEYPKTVTFQVDVLPPNYKTIDVSVIVYPREAVTPSSVKTAIQSVLEDFFEPMMLSGAPNPYVDFGFNFKDEDGNPAGEIAWSDVLNVIRDLTTYIRKVDSGETGLLLNGVRSDVQLANWEFPALGEVTVINGNTGTAI